MSTHRTRLSSLACANKMIELAQRYGFSTENIRIELEEFNASQPYLSFTKPMLIDPHNVEDRKNGEYLGGCISNEALQAQTDALGKLREALVKQGLLEAETEMGTRIPLSDETAAKLDAALQLAPRSRVR